MFIICLKNDKSLKCLWCRDAEEKKELILSNETKSEVSIYAGEAAPLSGQKEEVGSYRICQDT